MPSDNNEHYANWIAKNLTKGNRRLIESALSKPQIVREHVLLANLNTVITDRFQALCDAIDNGDCLAKVYPRLHNTDARIELAKAIRKYL